MSDYEFSSDSDFQFSECSVCFEQGSMFDFPDAGTLTACEHDARVCNDCHRDFIRTSRALAIDETSGDVQIACMTRGCSKGYHVSAINRCVVDNAARAEIYNRLSTVCFERASNAVYCTRPQCGVPIMIDHDNEPFCTLLVCTRCANHMCVACKRDAHDGVSCADYDSRSSSNSNNDNWTSEKLVNSISRCCPRCSSRIFREGGCPHMTCSRCSYEFCFGCLGARTYAFGKHHGCDRIAAQFENDAAHLLATMRKAEVRERRQAQILVARSQGAAVAAHRATLRADAMDEDTSEFDAFATFANVTEAPVGLFASMVDIVVRMMWFIVSHSHRQSTTSTQPTRSAIQSSIPVSSSWN